MLNLNETQSGVLTAVFKVADDEQLLLLDLKDLRAMLQHVGDHAAEFKTEYGNVATSSIGAIQRGLLALESQGAAQFFGEPMLALTDLMQSRDGKGVTEDRAIETLRRVKDDVKEVKAGLECGIKLAGYDDIKVGDVFEAYVRETFQRTL